MASRDLARASVEHAPHGAVTVPACRLLTTRFLEEKPGACFIGAVRGIEPCCQRDPRASK